VFESLEKANHEVLERLVAELAWLVAVEGQEILTWCLNPLLI
jgi:hypothetical protein